MRTYDVMVGLLREARPDLAARVQVSSLVAVLDENYPVEGGWRSKPLHEGIELLRDKLAGNAE